MNFLNDNISTDIQEQAKKFVGQGSDTPESHDFFKPLNDLDPMTKKPNKVVEIPKFDCKVFYITGGHSDLDDKPDIETYTDLMNESAEGKIQVLEKQIYNSKDGDITIFLEWLVLPASYQNPSSAAPREPGFEEFMANNKPGNYPKVDLQNDKIKKQRHRNKRSEAPEVYSDPSIVL